MSIEFISRQLKIVYWALIIFCPIYVAIYETGLLEEGGFEEYEQTEFLCATLMELSTLGLIVLALYLFKIKKVEAIITSSDEGFYRWALVRILMLGIPLVINTILYYAFVNPAFGYLAIITLIAMAFITPTLKRCERERYPEETDDTEDDR